MRNKKPVQVILFGSLFVTFAFGFISFLFTLVNFPAPVEIITSALITGVFTYLIFTYFIQKYISSRIKNIYASIERVQRNTKRTEEKYKGDIISAAQQDSESWKKERIKEISKLKEQEEFRREFLGNLAHELKTPIFSIQGYILTLLEGGLEDEKINRKFLERASKATERMTHLIEDLDHISKMEVDNIALNNKEFDLIQLIKDVFELAEIDAREKKISLSTKEDYDKTLVFADKNKIAQVLTNLINNSISYGNKNGNTVVSISKTKQMVTVNVIDDGPGISEENLPRIFERFYRVEKSRNRHKGGSGLGLSIVKHILESHEQTFEVNSEVGKGTKFTFTLPKRKIVTP